MPDKQTELKIGDDDLNFDDVLAVLDDEDNTDKQDKTNQSVINTTNERRFLTKEELERLLDW
jgi:hypothetical protein